MVSILGIDCIRTMKRKVKYSASAKTRIDRMRLTADHTFCRPHPAIQFCKKHIPTNTHSCSWRRLVRKQRTTLPWSSARYPSDESSVATATSHFFIPDRRTACVKSDRDTPRNRAVWMSFHRSHHIRQRFWTSKFANP